MNRTILPQTSFYENYTEFDKFIGIKKRNLLSFNAIFLPFNLFRCLFFHHPYFPIIQLFVGRNSSLELKEKKLLIRFIASKNIVIVNERDILFRVG